MEAENESPRLRHVYSTDADGHTEEMFEFSGSAMTRLQARAKLKSRQSSLRNCELATNLSAEPSKDAVVMDRSTGPSAEPSTESSAEAVPDPPRKSTRQRVVEEILSTERTFVKVGPESAPTPLQHPHGLQHYPRP